MDVDHELREQQAINALTRRLSTAFAPAHDEAEVTQVVETVRHRFDDTPIRDFVPVLVERLARDELRGEAPQKSTAL